MLVALLVAPLAFALLALAIPSNRMRPWLLPLAGCVHLTLTALVMRQTSALAWNGWIVVDPLGRVFLGFVSVLFMLCSVYAVGYLALRADHENRVFCACLLALLGMMTLILVAHHLGLMWVALEACTLTSAPLIYFNRTTRSLDPETHARIVEALRQHGGNVTAAARALGLHRTQLRRLLERHGIDTR